MSRRDWLIRLIEGVILVVLFSALILWALDALARMNG